MQRFANLVDLVKRFPTNIYLQKSASIQLKMSPDKFAVQIGLVGLVELVDIPAAGAARSSGACRSPKSKETRCPVPELGIFSASELGVTSELATPAE